MKGQPPGPAPVDPIIHAPARLSIMATLAAVREADFLYLLHVTQLTKGNLSAHLRKLEEAGYVEIEKTFRGKYPLTICRLRKRGAKPLKPTGSICWPSWSERKANPRRRDKMDGTGWGGESRPIPSVFGRASQGA